MANLQEELIFGGVSRWLMRAYLERMGYHKIDDDHYGIADIQVVLGEAAPHQVGNLSINRIAVTVTGQDKAELDQAIADIRFKAMRGGG